MPKQTKSPISHNRVIAFVREKKYLRMIELSEMDWQAIFNGEGIGSGRQKKDVELAFYLNAKDEVIMRWEKPKEVIKTPARELHSNNMAMLKELKDRGTTMPYLEDSVKEDLPWDDDGDKVGTGAGSAILL